MAKFKTPHFVKSILWHHTSSCKCSMCLNHKFVCLCWGLTSQSTIFQSCRDGAIASWVINQYFRGVKCLAQGHNTAAVGFEPPTSCSGVRHSTTEPPRSLNHICKVSECFSKNYGTSWFPRICIIYAPLRITKGNNSNRIGSYPFIFYYNGTSYWYHCFCKVSLTFQDIMAGRQMYGQRKQNTCLLQTICGGIKNWDTHNCFNNFELKWGYKMAKPFLFRKVCPFEGLIYINWSLSL